MPEFDGISEYVKSGLRRLRDAEEMSLSARRSSSSRYDPRPVSREDADARIEAARSLVDWIYSLI